MRLIFLGRQPEADGAVSFRFTPVEPLVWIAGQSIKIELPAGYGTEERRFTIAAPPIKKDIVITTRISASDFKQALATLSPGAEVTAYNIDGSFTWREASAPHIFAASGIGVTPFYAMLSQRALEGKPLSATLLYANTRQDFPLGKRLRGLSDEHPEFTLSFLPEKRIRAADILPHYTPHTTVYISGSSHAVDAIAMELLAADVPETHLMRDWFLGLPKQDGVQ